MYLHKYVILINTACPQDASIKTPTATNCADYIIPLGFIGPVMVFLKIEFCSFNVYTLKSLRSANFITA